MDLEPLRSRPPGVVAVVLLTVVFAIGQASASFFAILGSPHPAGQGEFVSAMAGFVVAYLLWRGYFAGWIAAVILYAALSVDLVIGATVFGLTGVPLFVLPIAAFAYLLVARTQFYGPSTESSAT
ncbi:hypothetical protein [Natronobacterium texcoconense]|uniref:Uncharacterized protein n=1 Tax=Natronobacterium texcoconense TaxID=1095778 RepID=A0A1H1C8E9_NATTX|nr:hypothetical protein [Natronobacterium texcoconense]SDQ60379.1 hypothetical protein SAMN04489842_1308 [Natronobacterium texcoconense]